MNKRKSSVIEKTIQNKFVLMIVFALSLTIVAHGQSRKPKKWTYDFSETVKYFDAPLAACQSLVKEKYPNFNYKASIEATNDPEMYRCSADGTYFGLVYETECKSCDGVLSSTGATQFRHNQSIFWLDSPASHQLNEETAGHKLSHSTKLWLFGREVKTDASTGAEILIC